MNTPIQKRLKDKFKEFPKWAEDFSIESNQDKNISRRDFIRFIALVSFGLFTGTAGVFLRSFLKENEAAPVGVKLFDRDQLAVGESRTFVIPGNKEPGILVRLEHDRYVAYGQKCTHLQCPVLWKKEVGKLVCPCHNGAFAVEDGHVLYGPPERPLPQLDIRVKEDGVYFMGVKDGMIV